MRADAEVEAKIVKHTHVIAGQVIRSQVGIAVGMTDLDVAPRRVSSNELRILAGPYRGVECAL